MNGMPKMGDHTPEEFAALLTVKDVARPVWARCLPIPLRELGPDAMALERLFGPDIVTHQHAQFMVAYTPGELCGCGQCSRDIQRIIDTIPGLDFSARMNGPLNRMILCPECGNKRCPRANHHDNLCTNSNEPGQPGSDYP